MTARSMLPLDPGLVGPWSLGDGRRGVLLLHGFAGTPPELRRLGEHLAACGWRCSAPALAGHASTPEELASTNWSDWVASAQNALDELLAQCDHVAVVGQSMGGTMALHLAATDLRISAVATLATPIWIHTPARPILRWGQHVIKWHTKVGPTDLYWTDSVEELHSYGRRSTHAVHQLFLFMRRVSMELPSVRAPLLVLHGLRDSVVNPRNAVAISRRAVCSREIQRHMYPRSGHAMSVDVDREDINRRVLEWFDRWIPNPATASAELGPTTSDTQPH